MKRVKPKAVKPKPYTIEDGSTQSLIGTWVHCREAARLYLEGWRGTSTKESLAFGGLEHFVLEGLYEGIRTESLRGLNEFFRTRVNAWKRKARGWATPVEAQTMELCVAKASAIFPQYCETWKKDFDPKIWRELEGVFDVTWQGYRLRGRIDGVREVGKSKKLWLLETKTMGRIDGSLDDALNFDFQCLFYMLCAEIALGKPVEGVLYNIVRRSGMKQKAGESLPQYTARVRDDAEKRPDHYFKRYELTFAPTERKRFARGLLAKLIEFETWINRDSCTYRDERSCRGRWNCDWLPACSSGSMAGYAKGGRLFEELE